MKYILAETPPQHIRDELSVYSPVVQQLLYTRGIITNEDAEKFLSPSYESGVYDPFLILNMDKAVERIITAIDSGERIIVYGDYDCDGIPGSVILHDFFKKIGYSNARVYIPHRHDEGYGLNKRAIDTFASEGVSLIITVDSGITDVEEVAHANTHGIDTIITDHHLPGEVLPEAYAIINSKQKDDIYPDSMLCGAGVAFKLVQALLLKEKNRFGVQEGWEKWLLDMAGISTVADMVPLKNENRVLAYYGLKVLRKSRRPGLKELLRITRVSQMHITEDDIGFMIAPRINAASRMDVPRRAFELLATETQEEAKELAKHLENLNKERKLLVARIVKDAKKRLSEREIADVIVLGKPEWKVGVLGIACSNLVEEYDRPVFLWSREGDSIKGSCRGNGTCNVVELMRAVPEGVFENVGGHAEAGGFSISQDNIHALEEHLITAYQKVKKGKKARTEIIVDAELSLSEVHWQLFHDINQLAPFGIENKKPLFKIKDVYIKNISQFGKDNNHLKVVLADDGVAGVEAIGFFMNKENLTRSDVESGARADVVGSIEKSVFRGKPELRVRVIDVI